MSAILESLGEGSVDEVGIYTSEKLAPQKGIAIEIASISVSVPKLLVLPVWVQFLLPVCT